MKIIDDIIEKLTDESVSLTDVLIKTKVLAFKLKNQQLIDWIDNELKGYPNEQIPNYRNRTWQIIGNITNGYRTYQNYPIPIQNLKEEMKNALTAFNLRQSISSLDDFVRNRDNTKLVLNLPPEWYHELSNGLDNDFIVQFARLEIGKTQIVEVLTSVKTTLLDFLLKLNNEVGDSDDINSLTQGAEKEKVASLFGSTVFGDNTTIIVGNNNTQTVSNSINSAGNFEELKDSLLATGMDKKDVDELEEIIDNDNPDPINCEFGSKVKYWVLNMINKTMNNSWKIGLGAAGNVLSEAINRYYGWK